MINADTAAIFIISATLLVTVNVGLTVGLALITDLFPSSSYGRLLALYNSTVWIGAIGGFALAGNMLEYFGASNTFAIASALALLGVALLVPVKEEARRGIERQVVSSGRTLGIDTIAGTVQSYETIDVNRSPNLNGGWNAYGKRADVYLELMIMSGPNDGLIHRLSGALDYHHDLHVVCCRFTIGRQEACHVTIPFDVTASSVHATLHVSDDGQVWLFDENSLNGSYVGRERLSDMAVPLEDRQLFRIGKTWMRVQCLDVDQVQLDEVTPY
jgi:hypothetical protein